MILERGDVGFFVSTLFYDHSSSETHQRHDARITHDVYVAVGVVRVFRVVRVVRARIKSYSREVWMNGVWMHVLSCEGSQSRDANNERETMRGKQ